MKMDFARAPGFRRTSLLVLAVGIGGSAHAIWQRHQLLQQRSALASKIEASARVRPAAESRTAAAPDPMAAGEMEKIVVALRSPWEDALDALQRALKPDVVVTRMVPEAQGTRLRILGRADSSDAFLDFAQRLRDDAFWRRVDPVSEAVQEEGLPSSRPLAFQLALEWAQP